MTPPESEPAETADEEIETHWIAVLAEYWRQADWDAFGGAQKARADTFGERVEVAARAGDVHGAFQKLAKGLGMAVPDLPTEHTDPLVNADDEAMRTLRRERVWLVNKANETIQNYFDALDADDGESDGNSATTSELTDFIEN